MRFLRARLPWIWTGVVVVLGVVLVLEGGLQDQGWNSWLADLAWLSLPILFTALGAVIFARQPGNRIGWILFVIADGIILDAFLQSFVTDTKPDPVTTLDFVAAMLVNTTWIVIFFPLFLLLFVFPTGRFLTAGWRWAAWLEGVMVTMFALSAIFGETVGDPERWTVDNPIGFISDNLINAVLGAPWLAGLLALVVGGVAAMVVRFRRSDHATRAQIKWVLLACVILGLSYVATLILNQMQITSPLLDVLFTLSLGAIPIAITLAIVRYRLFEIDRLISRTISYTVVVGLLAAIYFGLITVVTDLIPTQNSLVVAASTLAVAAIFNPLRRRVQRLVDRRFNRSAYVGDALSEEFAAKLRDSVTVEALAEVWSRTVTETYQPSAIGLWLNQAVEPKALGLLMRAEPLRAQHSEPPLPKR